MVGILPFAAGSIRALLDAAAGLDASLTACCLLAALPIGMIVFTSFALSLAQSVSKT